MAPFPLQRKRSATLGSTLSPVSDSAQGMSRTQRALSRLSRLRLPSMRAESSRPSLPHTPASSNSVDSRPLKHARRQSRSFSTFFSSPLSPSPSPSPSPAPPSSSSRRIALKRTNSFPALIEYPKSPAASIFPDNLDRDSWGAPRDVTLRLEKANLESTYSPAATTATTAPIVPFPRSAAPTHHYAQTHRSFRLDDDDLVVYDTPPEVSRFSSSTEDHSCDTTTTMSVSSCASSSIVAPLSPRAVLDVFTAPRDSVGEPLDLDFELERGLPRSSPPSPQVYRHQPVVSHPHAYLGDVSMASPTPVPRGPSARKWAKSSTSSSSRDVMDPAMEGFSFAATSAVVLGADALLSSKNRPTPRIVPVGANTPSPFLLPRPVAAGSPSLSSLILEDLTTEFNKVAPVELPCGYDLPSTPISPSSPVWHGRPIPTFAPSPPSTPRPAAGPDTPTPVAFPFHCPSPPPSCARKPSRTQLAPLSISPSPLPRTNCPSTSSTCTSASTSSTSLSPSLTSTSSLSLFSPFTFGSASASASDMGSFPSPPTSPASSTAYYPRGAGRMRPKVLPPSPESVVMVEAVSNRRF